MSSIINISASTDMPIDLAKKIGLNGINEIMTVFWAAYFDMKEDANIVIDKNAEEDDITLQWYQKIMAIWDSRNRATSITLNTVIPFHQYPDNTLKKRKGVKAPTIDFCFKDWQNTSYFGAECKNLYDNSESKVKRYIDTGVNNYISGRYGSQSTTNSIIGYVLTGNILEIVNQLNGAMGTLGLANIYRDFQRTEPQYKSKHTRSLDDTDIEILHLFFDFTDK